MREFAKPFYQSKAWKDCRKAYAASVGGLCERCLAKGIYRAGIIVHHKIHLNQDNISDPSITLSFDNLQLLCMDCHADIHADRQHRYKVDQYGRVTT